jgi:hypothetical protein
VASLTKRSTSQFWVACFIDRHGRRLKRSTATVDRKRAQEIADEYEAAARRKRTALQVRRVITQLHQEITGDEVSQTSLRNFLNSWLERKAPEIAHSSLTFYGNAANRFLAFLGDTADADLTEITREHITRFRNEEAKWFAPKTVNHEVKFLRMIFRAGRGRGTFRPRDQSVFIWEGDYWTIRYQGQGAILKATRGLDCLGHLLRHPRREIHVSELLATLIEVPAPALLGGLWEGGGDAVTGGLQDAGPILDSQAKAEYKRRIEELRNDLKEAERFNDSYRAARARSEMDAIAEQLAAAVGLGGRDRRASSDAERARSAVTKRIKQAIQKIGDAIPALGHHLTARIKTGYFCSYNPHPDRPVSWKF